MADIGVTLRITADARGARAGIEGVTRELGDIVPAATAAGAAGQRAGDQIEGGMGRARAGVQSISQQLERFQTVLGAVAATAAGLATLQGVIQLADQYGQVSARIRNVIGDSMALATAQDAVFEVAQRTRASLSATGDLVSSLARSYTAAGMSAEQAFGTSLRLSEAINNAITASGTSAATATGMITQLNQALSAGTLRGDEFNSMMEGSPRLAQALAAGLDVPIGRLRAMAEAGELTREAITRALTGAQFDVLAAEAAAMPATVAQGWQQLSNAFQQYVGRLNESLGATSAVAGVMKALADNFDTVAEAAMAAAAAALAYAGAQGLAALGGAANAASNLLAALVTRLNIVTPLFAWATGGMSGTVAAMTAMKNAGGAVLSMLGGWPVVITAAATGLTILIARLLSAGDAAADAARKAREEQRKLAMSVAEARESRRMANPNEILADIAAQERVLRNLLRANTENSIAVIRQREYLAALRAEYARASTSAAGLAGANGTAAAAAEKHNAALRQQVQALREQLARASGGAAAVEELRAKTIEWSQATAEQRAENARLMQELRGLEAQIKTTSASTAGRAAATRAAAAADGEAMAAAKAHADALSRLTRMSDDLAAELGGPAVRAAQQLRDRLVELDRIEQQLIATGMSAVDAAARVSQARLQANEAYQQSTRDTADVVIASGQQIVDAAAEQSRSWGDYWTDAGHAMANAVGDWVANGFRGLADALKRIVRTVVSDFVAMMARQRLVLPMMASLGFPIGAQAGTVAQLAGQGGMFGPLGNVIGGLSQGLGGFLGAGLSSIGGWLSQGALFQGAGLLGSLGNFGSGLATAGSNMAGAGFFGSMGANLSGGFAALGSGSIAAGLGQLIPVIGQIAGIATAINALTGGRLFGTSFRPEGQTTSLTLGADGGAASASVREVRQRSLFRGRTWRDRSVDASDEAVRAAQELFARVREVMVQAARSMQAEAPQMISAALRTVQEFDKNGKVTATRYFVDLLGRTWEEATAEAATMRISAEALIRTIDAALGTTVSAAATAVADAGTEVVGAFGDAVIGSAGEIRDDLGTGISTMLKGASQAVQGEASAIAERWRADAAALMDGATMLLAAATDIRRGAGLLGDGSLTAVADLIEELRADGESLTAAYARVSGATRLLQEALDLSGLTLDKTREDFVRFAAGIADAAGGLDRAQQLWSSYFQTFFTEQERALLAQQRALANANREFADIGLSVGDYTGAGGLQAFRAAFEQVLQTGSAEAIVQWLEAAEALGVLNDATARLGDQAIITAETLRDFMAGVDAALADGNASLGLSEQLAAQRAANDEMLARARELGASEAELARVRQLGDRRISEIIASVSQQTATLTGALRRLGIAVNGSAEDIALLASTMSSDFQSLFNEFLGTFYSEAEQGAQRLAMAQANLSAALQAAGLSTDNLISLEQLRAQIEAALADGNIALAEALLRVASAMNAVESAANSAAGSLGGTPIGNYYGGYYGGGSGLGFGGNDPTTNDPTDGAAQRLIEEIERIRQGLRDWLQSLTTGDLSPLRPRDQLREARAELARLVAAAQAGDLEAMRQLSSAGSAVLRLGQQVFRGDQYRNLFDEVRRLIGGVAGIDVTPIGGGSGGGGVGIRPADDLGDLGRSALNAAAALDQLAARAGMPPGSLIIPPPQTIRPFVGAGDDSARPVVSELQRGRADAREDNARLRAEIAELAAQMRALREAAERQAEQLARANDYRRV
jgi:tape measure domain-containing protein